MAAASFTDPSPGVAGLASAPGFAPPDLTLFAPVLELAPPGPSQAARAIDLFSRRLEFRRIFAFHPLFGAKLQNVIDEMPPRESTLIRAAAMYSNPNIPWSVEPAGVHRISVTGRPLGGNYLYTLSPGHEPPETPGAFAGSLALAPTSDDDRGSNVIFGLQGQLLTDTYGLGAMIDAVSAIFRQTRGDLKPPWDKTRGVYNHHDAAAMARFRHYLPTFDRQLEKYLEIDNVLDEFDGPHGPRVLFNLKAAIRPEALKPFPHLYRFYTEVAPRLVTKSAILDSHGDYWMRSEFNRGHLRLVFMVERGMLTPFDSNYRPAGTPVALDRIARGRYRLVSSVHVTSLGMNFGLDDLSFANSFSRTPGYVKFEGKMDAVPQLVAPPVVSQLMKLVAGRFLRVMAQNGGGMTTVGFSRRTAAGAWEIGGGLHCELHDSPALGFLARVGDRLADADNAQVRREERELGLQLFDAFVTDYNNARPQILALGRARAHQDERSRTVSPGSRSSDRSARHGMWRASRPTRATRGLRSFRAKARDRSLRARRGQFRSSGDSGRDSRPDERLDASAGRNCLRDGQQR